MTRYGSIVIGAVALLQSGTAVSGAPTDDRSVRMPVSEFPKPVPFPNQDDKAFRVHWNRARHIAGQDLYVFFDTLCIQDQLYKVRTQGAQMNGIVTPQRVFDNLYYVGQNEVGAWAHKTSSGLILFDTLDNADQARNIIVPGLVQMGLDPKDIKYVVITHSHPDHYGGARYLKDTFGASLVASARDWDVMAKVSAATLSPKFDPPPARTASDIALKDSDTLTLGDITVRFTVTPGHTPGTLSSMFKVTDNGVPHLVGFYAGIGMPRTVETQNQQIASMTNWMKITKAAGVDAEIGNHPLHFDGPARLELLKYREPGEPHPFVIGPAAYQRYIDLQRECVRMELAREGQPSG